ncbi:MAG: sulfite exporter TauE/SafE family protein, partial [Candidatus Curtissbacteria bacterium]|nr:sulfite exporter TauE/SafE family protein [Candidatus Curtissbacteria bacterium]
MDEEQKLTKIELKIYGMTCHSCEVLILQKFNQIMGIEKAYAHYQEGKAEIYCSQEPTISQLQESLSEYNFRVVLWSDRDNKQETLRTHTSSGDFLRFIPLVLFIGGIYLVFNKSNFSFQVPNVDSINLWVIFLTGLTVGGLTCLAVQGGLLASVIAAREEGSALGRGTAKHAMYATGVFLITKYIAYVVLGFILGAFGGALNIGGRFQVIMQLAAGLYMVAVALNLLNIHPIFRFVIIQPPRFLTRMVRNQSKSKDLFAPSLLGAMTVFIPCGTTIAMEALAISSANAFVGASIMAAFILGTIPLFFGIGVITSVMGEAFKTKFLKLAAIAVIYLGVSSINGSMVALGSPLTLQSITENFPAILNVGKSGEQKSQKTDLATTQNAEINVTSYG